MASIAAERSRAGAARVNPAIWRSLLRAAVLGLLWGLWEGYRALGIHFGWTHPFVVDDTSMPHIHTVIRALFERPNPEAPLLVVTLLKAAAFTAKEAALGFAMGATGGFVIGALLAHSRMLQRGFLPYVVASQTVPILAIAPMVVVWLSSVHVTAWVSVAVISAYLTFFPVAISTLRGLQAADHRAVELMRSYAANRWTVLWKLRFPTSLPYLFSALRISATASIVGAIIGELPSSIAGGLGGAILNFAQYYSFQPQNLWATNIIAAALGIAFFLVVVAAEKLVVRRAPENVA
jgi:ABC-type nitrate/sulfonate/bicarbonate transport system, permease component